MSAYDVDQRVLEMKFDNQQFEKNAGDTINTLKNLDSALNVKSAPLSEALDVVKGKFSALETIATGALLNIGYRISNLAINLTKSLSTDQISQGWGKYAEKTQSVQTIMASTAHQFDDTGKQMSYVNGQLDKLNWFTDETSYNFLDMTNNIGKFTANGVKLEDAVTSMQGIANWAAISGGKVQEAGRAMYNLSQAMGMGYVGLMDWKSIELANMATLEFKQTALDTAVAMGKIGKEGDQYYSLVGDVTKNERFNAFNFREGLKDKWLDVEVLNSVLKKYGDAANEVHNFSEKTDATATRILKIIDKYKEGSLDMAATAKELNITAPELTEWLKKMSSETYELGLKSFKAAQEAKTFGEAIAATKDAVSTGWMKTFELIFGDYEQAKKIWTGLASELYDIFMPGILARNDLLKSWNELGGREVFFEGIAKHWSNLKDIFGTIKDAFRDIFPPKTAEDLKAFTDGFSALADKLKPSEETLDKLRRTFKGLFAVIDIFKILATQLVQALFPGTKVISSLADGILTLTANLGDKLVALRDWIRDGGTITGIFRNLGEAVQFLSEKIVSFLNSFKKSRPEEIKKSITEPSKWILFLNGVIDTLLTTLGKLSPVLDSVIEGIKKIAASFGERVKNAYDEHGITGVVNIFNGAIGLLFKYNLVKMSSHLKNFLGIFKTTVDLSTFGVLKEQFMGFLTGLQSQLKAATMIKIATAIALLTGSIIAISLIDSGKLATSVGVLTAMFTELAITMYALNMIGTKKSLTGAVGATKGLASLAFSIDLLSGALVKISKIDPDRLNGTLRAFTIMLTEVIGTSILLEKYGGKIELNATKLITLAFAMRILAGVVEKLSEIQPEKLKQGMVALGTMMIELGTFLKFTERQKGIKSFGAGSATGFVILAGSLMILVKAVEQFGSMDAEVVKQGLITIGVILAEFAIFQKALNGVKKSVSSATAVTILAGALLLLKKPLMEFGAMPVENIAKALTMLGGTIGIFVGALMVLKPDALIKKSAALVIAAMSMKMLAKPLLAFSTLNIEEVASALITLGGAMAILVGGLVLMGSRASLKGAASLLVAASALAILAVPIKMFSALSFDQLAVGLGALAGSMFIMAAGLAAMTPGVGVLRAMAMLFGAVALTLVSFTSAIQLLITGFKVQALKEMLFAILAMIRDLAPQFADAVVNLVVEMIRSLSENIPETVNLLADLIINTMIALREKVPVIIQEGVNLLVAIFSGIIDVLNATNPEAIQKTLMGLTFMAGLMTVSAGLNAIAKPALKGLGWLAVFVAEFSAIVMAFGAVGQIPGVKWLLSEGFDVLAIIGGGIGEFVGSVIGGFAEGATSHLPEIGKNLSGFMTEAGYFFETVSGVGKEGFEALGFLTDALIKFAAADIMSALGAIGKFLNGGKSTLTRFGEDLEGFGSNLAAFAQKTKNVDSHALLAIGIGVQVLAKAADLLPVVGGLRSLFEGDHMTLSAFGEELAEFAPYLKDFSDKMKGIDSKSLTSASEAAKMLGEMAGSLPKLGGFSEQIFGESKTLTDFGKELASFAGPFLLYSNIVKKVDATAVERSASAAQMLADLANSLPSSEGLSQVIFGEKKNLSDFGAELSIFGPYLAKYARSVRGVKTDDVTASAEAGKMLADLAESVPETGGLFQFFGGEHDLAKFGEGLVGFGNALSGYFEATKEIDKDILLGVIYSTARLVDIAKSIGETDPNGLAKLGTSLSKLAEADIDAFITKFKDAYVKVEEAITAFMTYAVKALKSNESEFKNNFKRIAEESIHTFSATFKAGKILIEAPIKEFGDHIVDKFNSNLKKETFNQLGGRLMGDIMEGIKNYTPEVDISVKTITDFIQSQFSSGLPTVTYQDLGQRVVSDIQKGMFLRKVELISYTAVFSAEILKNLDRHFSAEKFKNFGARIPKSIQTGIVDNQATAVHSVNNLGQSLYSAISEPLSSDRMASLINRAMQTLTHGLNNAKKAVREESNYIAVQVEKGYDQGLWSGRKKITKTTGKVFGSATTTARKELDIHSPSREFYDIAVFVVAGFAKGLIDSKPLLIKTLEEEFIAPIRLKTDLSATGEAMLSTAYLGIENIKEDFFEKLAQLCEEIVGIFQQELIDSGKFSGIGEGMSDEIARGVESKRHELIDLARNIAEEMSRTFSENFKIDAQAGGYDGGGSYDSTGYEPGPNSPLDSVDEYPEYNKRSNPYDSLPAVDEYPKKGKYETSIFDNLDSVDEFPNYKVGKTIAQDVLKGYNSVIGSPGPRLAPKPQMQRLFKDAVQGVKKDLRIKSPSGVFYDIAQNVLKGYYFGSIDGKPLVDKALAESLYNPLQHITSLVEGVDVTPSITPVIDLNGVDEGVNRINRAFKGLDTTLAYDLVLSANPDKNKSNIFRNDKEKEEKQTINNWNMTQNNYSPKALSRSEIYRQTRNQFSTLREAVETL